MVRGDRGRRNDRRGGSFGRNSGFRDFDRDRFGDRRRGGDRNGDGDDRRSQSRFGGRDRRDDRPSRGGRRGRGRGRGNRDDRGGDIESRLNNYWKKHNKESRNDGEITAELDDYWKKGKQNEAAKREKTETTATEQPTTTNGANKDKEVEL